MTKLMDMLETNKEKKDIECNELIYIYIYMLRLIIT